MKKKLEQLLVLLDTTMFSLEEESPKVISETEFQEIDKTANDLERKIKQIIAAHYKN